MTQPLALLTRPVAQNAEIQDDVTALGYPVFSAPMLTIHKLAHDPLSYIENTALVFTSARAAEMLDIDTKNAAVWDMPIYNVGDHTADILRTKGFNAVLKTTETAAQLQAHFDGENTISAENMLYVSGEYISHHFLKNGIKIPRKRVYTAETVENFTENLRYNLHNGNVGVVLFYSVRTAENFLKILKKEKLQQKCTTINCICISTRTAESLKSVHWKTVHIAEQAEHKHMMLALAKVEI